MLSSFFVSIDSADRPWSPQPSYFSRSINSGGRTITIDFLHGPILLDHAQRKQRMEFVQKILKIGDRMEIPSVVVVGTWLSYIIELTPNAKPESEFPDYYAERGNVIYVPLMTNEFLNRFYKDDRRLYYLPTVDQYNLRVEHLDLRSAGAKELEID